MRRWTVFLGALLACAATAEAKFSGVEILSEGYHVRGTISIPGFSDSYDVGASVPVSASIDTSGGGMPPEYVAWAESLTTCGPGMMGPDVYGVRAWAYELGLAQPFEVSALAEIAVNFRPYGPILEFAWWAEPTWGGSGVYCSAVITDTSDSSSLYSRDNIMPDWTSFDDVRLWVDPTHIYSLHLYAGMAGPSENPALAEVITLQSIPLPGALPLAAIGTGLAMYLRRRTG
jgi:hypothetical protein